MDNGPERSNVTDRRESLRAARDRGALTQIKRLGRGSIYINFIPEPRRTMETESRGSVQLSVVRPAEPQLPVHALRQKATFARRRTRRLALAIATLGVAAVAFIVSRILLQPPMVEIVQPSRGPAIEAVYATGVIEPIDYARFGATVAGRVAELRVDEGDEVRKGGIVARLDDRQPRARLQDAKARLTMAEAEIARDQTLMNRGVLAAQTLERAQQERDQAAAAVDLFARQLEDYTVSSPLDGTVMKRDVEVGETVAANAVMFEISSTARKRIAADVDERDIAGVRLGTALAAHADGFPDEAFVVDLSVLVVVAVIRVAALIEPVIGHAVS